MSVSTTKPDATVTIAVSLVDLDASTAPDHVLRDLLDPDERLAVERPLAPSERRRRLVAKAALRLLLAAATGLQPRALVFVQGWRGKPALAGAAVGLHFSWSHSSELAALALSRDAPVGIDIEHVGVIDADVSESILSTDELAVVAALPVAARQTCLHRLWVRKEAILKADGAGLGIAPQCVEIVHAWPPGVRPVRLPPQLGDRGAWSVLDLEAALPAGVVGAVAMQRPATHIPAPTFVAIDLLARRVVR